VVCKQNSIIIGYEQRERSGERSLLPTIARGESP
jgi:hypothetical protein